MKWHVLAATFFTTSIALAEPAAITVMPPNQNNANSASDQPVDPCVTSTSGYARDACERTQQAARARNKQEQQQATTPTTMPAWQQALQPPPPASPPNTTEQTSGGTETSSQTPAYP